MSMAACICSSRLNLSVFYMRMYLEGMRSQRENTGNRRRFLFVRRSAWRGLSSGSTTVHVEDRTVALLVHDDVDLVLDFEVLRCADLRRRTGIVTESHEGEQTAAVHEPPPCPCCGGRMRVTEFFDGPMSTPYHVRRIDSS